MRRLIYVLLLLITLPPWGRAATPSTLPRSASGPPPTATPGPTEVITTATPPPPIVQPTAKPPRPTYTPTRTTMVTKTPTSTPTTTATPAPIYELHLGDNWLEAERPTDPNTGAWQQRGDDPASGGQYLIATTDNAGTLEYRFSLDYEGTIYIWLRAIRAPTTERPIRIRLDSRGNDPATVRSTAWAWTLDDDASYDVSPGTHTFRIEALAAGVKLDEILITTNRATVP